MKRILLALTLTACIGTETGNPPVQPELDANLLMFSEDGDQVQVQGLAGSVIPGGADVQLTPLDGSPAFRVMSELDGSFVIERPFTAEVRLQAIEGRGRSDVFDHRFLSDVQMEVCRPIPDTDFIRVEGNPGEEAIGYVTVRWPCGNPPSASMLYGDQGLSVEGVGFQAEQSMLTLAITFDGRTGELEDHVVVSMSGSSAVITIVAEACGSDCDL